MQENIEAEWTPWVLILSAAAILMISMGIRQSTGLFVSPLVMSTGQSIVAISFALAIGQLVWGAVQPIFGAVADKWGSVRVIIFGAVLLAAGMGLTPYVSSEWGLIVTMGLISPAGAGAGSFALLFGAIARHILKSGAHLQAASSMRAVHLDSSFLSP